MASRRNTQCFNEKSVQLLVDTMRVYIYTDTQDEECFSENNTHLFFDIIRVYYSIKKNRCGGCLNKTRGQLDKIFGQWVQ